ncbi:MAG TPA: hypothetical protein VGE56_08005 [Rhodocyclaceae bacterium]
MAKNKPAPVVEAAPSDAPASDASLVEGDVPEVEEEADPALNPVEAVASGPMVKGRILRACVYGQCDDVVEVDASLVEQLAGIIDTDPAAVAYAESLK